MKKICFSGYRPYKLPFKISPADSGYLKFCIRAENLIQQQIELGNKYFISGMAQGADLILAQIALKLKQKYADVFLECALPFPCQSQKWSNNYKSCYDNILQYCDKITTVCGKYSPHSFMQRNMYMVESSDIVIAVYDGKKGGTRFTCNYAQKKGREIIILNPAQNSIYCQQSIKKFI